MYENVKVKNNGRSRSGNGAASNGNDKNSKDSQIQFKEKT